MSTDTDADAEDTSETETETEIETDADTEREKEKATRRRWRKVRLAYDDGPKYKARHDLIRLLNDEFDVMAARDLAADEKGPLWIYNPETGQYRKDGAGTIRQLVSGQLPKHAGISKHERGEIIDALRVKNQVAREAFDAGDTDENLLCLSNGVLDVETGDVDDHSPEHGFTKGLGIEYDADADCPAIDEFFESITGSDADTDADKQALYELVGWCLAERYQPPSIMLLVGDGGNGKSVFLRLLRTFLGVENVEGFDLHALARDENYCTAELLGAMANIGGDIPSKKLSDVSRIKKLTGSDPIDARRPYEPPFNFENTAKLLFAVNEPPIIPESGRRIERRLRYIEFPHTFTNDPDDGNPDRIPETELMDSLTDPGELSGLLNQALSALSDLRDRGEWCHVTDSGEHIAEYDALADPIARFGGDCLTNAPHACVTKAAVYAAYKAWCEANDETPKAEATFFRALAGSQSFDADAKRRRSIDGRERIYDGAALTPAGRELCPETIRQTSDETNDYVHGTSAVDKGREGVGDETSAETSDFTGSAQPQSELIDEVLRAIRELPDPDPETVRHTVGFAGYDPDRVAGAIDHLKERGEITTIDGAMIDTT